MRNAIVAVCCNEPNIIEWCEYHLKLGFSHIFIALNNCTHEYIEFCNSLQLQDVTFMKFDIQRTILAPQFAFYNSVIKAHSDKFDWMCCLDIDEYLWLDQLSVPEFFAQHEDDYCIAFNWKYFAAKEDIAEPSDSLLKRFTWCQHGFNKHVKIAAHLSKIKDAGLQSCCFMVNPHVLGHPMCQITTVTPDGEQVHGPYFEGRHIADAWIAHFYSKTKKEFEDKIRRGRPDCNRDSASQYYRQVQHMWQEYQKCRCTDKECTLLRDFLYGRLPQ